MTDPTNSSPIGRLLEEVSWEGNARKYRRGGLGLENVLVTEVFQSLDLLPRAAFLAEMLRRAHGDDSVLDRVASHSEDAVVDVLPGGPDLAPGGPNVQPDALLVMPRAVVLVEAKGPRAGSFQTEQLAREYLVLMRDHAADSHVLLLVLPTPPPILVKGRGRRSIRDAVVEQLDAVRSRALDPPPRDELVELIETTCAWITWAEIDQVLADGQDSLVGLAGSVEASVRRTADAGRRAIALHSGQADALTTRRE